MSVRQHSTVLAEPGGRRLQLALSTTHCLFQCAMYDVRKKHNPSNSSSNVSDSRHHTQTQCQTKGGLSVLDATIQSRTLMRAHTQTHTELAHQHTVEPSSTSAKQHVPICQI